LKQRSLLTALIATALGYFMILAGVAVNRVERAAAGEGDAEILAYAAPTAQARAQWREARYAR
jgi:hypothetical protein